MPRRQAVPEGAAARSTRSTAARRGRVRTSRSRLAWRTWFAGVKPAGGAIVVVETGNVVVVVVVPVTSVVVTVEGTIVKVVQAMLVVVKVSVT